MRLKHPKMEYYRHLYADSKMWKGDESLEGKQVIVYCEQGLGDIIQFLRYIPLLKTRGCDIIIHCPLPIHSLLDYISGVDGYFDREDIKIPEHDFHILLLDLPFLLSAQRISLEDWWCGNVESVIAEIHADIPPSPYVDFHEKADVDLEGYKIGIAWEGNPDYPDNVYRSCPLRHFAHLSGNLFSLQKEVILPELTTGCDDMKLWGIKIDSLKDTAALINAVDVVVTVDTVILHLAGALGKKTYGILGNKPDPRWGKMKINTIWYPSVKLIRKGIFWNQSLQKVEKLIQYKNNLLFL